MGKGKERRSERQKRVLTALVELYIETGKPVGSQTLSEGACADLSSATIRNYFAELEAEGLLLQQHTSGGRIPTDQAFALYADLVRESVKTNESLCHQLSAALDRETKELSNYLREGVELLSEVTQLAAFLSTPRFDHDFVLEIRLISLGEGRLLGIMITDFGAILTETLQVEERFSLHALKRMEGYFLAKITGQSIEEPLSDEELERAQQIYNELMLRYITRYSNFSEMDLFRTGFAQLLSYPELNTPLRMAGALSLFESPGQMNQILRLAERKEEATTWIGGELQALIPSATECAILAMPYKIQGVNVGAAAILGPMRLPYPKLFGILHAFVEQINRGLEKSLQRFNIQYRKPKAGMLYLQEQERRLLVEDKRSHNP